MDTLKRVLVIDDDQPIREVLQELLEGHFTITTAPNGLVGLELAQTLRPDLILCDIQMPQMNGYEVLQALHQNPTTTAIPFIFLTSQSTKADVYQGMELGAHDYLSKLCSAEELLAAIGQRLTPQSAPQIQVEQQLEHLRSTMALSLPHELLTPINGILGGIELLRLSATDPEMLDEIDMIYASAERLYEFAKNMLLYAELEVTLRDRDWLNRLDQGVTTEPKFIITHVANQIAEQMQRARDLNLNLKTVAIAIPEHRLQKVMQELIHNAFKFSQPGSPVKITGIVHPLGLTIEIMNSGRGMTPEQIAEIGAYRQFDRKLYEQQGIGLGLCIAKHMVELYGGKLVVKSNAAEETIVQVKFPVS
jgi:CheY-like chemotaxis protein